MLSLLGGGLSLFTAILIPVPDPGVYGPIVLSISYFIIVLKIILGVTGVITISGAFMYLMDNPSAGIVILIGAIFGGLNIISLLGGAIAFADCRKAKKGQKLVKRAKILKSVERWLSAYLEENKGKAFTAIALRKRFVEEHHLKISITETEKLLYDLYLSGKCKLNTKENSNYYFAP